MPIIPVTHAHAGRHHVDDQPVDRAQDRGGFAGGRRRDDGPAGDRGRGGDAAPGRQRHRCGRGRGLRGRGGGALQQRAGGHRGDGGARSGHRAHHGLRRHGHAARGHTRRPVRARRPACRGRAVRLAGHQGRRQQHRLEDACRARHAGLPAAGARALRPVAPGGRAGAGHPPCREGLPDRLVHRTRHGRQPAPPAPLPGKPAGDVPPRRHGVARADARGGRRHLPPARPGVVAAPDRRRRRRRLLPRAHRREDRRRHGRARRSAVGR